MRPQSLGRRLLERWLAAVLAIVVVGGAVDWGHAGGDDPDCNPAPLHHDHSAHRFDAAPSKAPQPLEHCYICHSLRAFHTSLATGRARVAAPPESTLLAHREGAAVRNAHGVALSSRAPPVVSL